MEVERTESAEDPFDGETPEESELFAQALSAAVTAIGTDPAPA